MHGAQMEKKMSVNSGRGLLRLSLASMFLMSASTFSVSALAQDGDERTGKGEGAEIEEIIVSGIRASERAAIDIKRLGSGVAVIPDETDGGVELQKLRERYRSQTIHLEAMQKRVEELSNAVASLRRQRDVRTKMLNAVLLNELDFYGS